jgi:hypothetical protein
MNRLRFYLNKKLDERMAEEFLNVHGGGVDFGEGIIKIHPQLKSIRSLRDVRQKKKAIRIYFNTYYRIHRTEMIRKLKRVRDAWRKYEQKYINITEKFFGGFQFPKGKYIAYASIINCNPRFLDSKTFQFFYKKPIDDAVYTIAHELLHFIFFDFVKKKFKKEIKELSEDQLWSFSEIFNVVILGSHQYRKIINQKFVIAYPEHQQYIKQFQKAYENSQNVKEFIRKGIAIIKAKKITGE